ncbi:MAG: hypothetical protein GC181_10250 [Bacteroidetes bacterium]|nr:hypothetical protein [Bacteroidota bacterium]
MRQYLTLILLLTGFALHTSAQKVQMDTLGITNGSVHMKGSFPYTKFLKKSKSQTKLAVHVWYNPSGSSINKSEIKAGKDEVYFLYGRNLKTGQSEMDFKFGANALKEFSGKKEKDLQEFIDFFLFDIFPNQHFNADKAMEALLEALEK